MTHFIKYRKHGEKKFWFVGDGGRGVRLRIYALRWTDEKAIAAVKALSEANPELEIKAVRIAKAQGQAVTP